MTMSDAPRSYRALLAVPGFPRLLGSILLARTSLQMTALVLVLFVLDRFGSPQLAGVAVLASILPGLLLSPLAGALLDRGARLRLVTLDYFVAAGALATVMLLAMAGLLRPWSLLLILVCGSVTAPLSNSGVRSLVPSMVPRALWDRANALDSAGYVVATVVGPGLAGVVVAVMHPTLALLLPAGFALAAAALLVGLRVPPQPAAPTRGSLLADAWQGLAYVMHNRGLRGLAITTTVCNLGGGAVTVAVPVLVLARLHGTSAEVGALFAVMGGGGILAGLLSGRLDSEGRERDLLAVGAVGMVAGMAVLAMAPGFAVAAIGIALFGASNGPFDIGLFSMRQRVTEPAWFGRAFAVSMSVNYIGFPLGSTIAGPLVAHSVAASFAAAAGFGVAGLVAALLTVPGGRPARRAERDTAVAGRAHPR
jgi:MFS family permease